MDSPYDLHFMLTIILSLLQKFFTPEQIENPKLVLIVGCTGKIFCLFAMFQYSPLDFFFSQIVRFRVNECNFITSSPIGLSCMGFLMPVLKEIETPQ